MYYDALIIWCEQHCDEVYKIESSDGSIHCYDHGRLVDYQDVPRSRPCLKCPYGRDHIGGMAITKEIGKTKQKSI